MQYVKHIILFLIMGVLPTLYAEQQTVRMEASVAQPEVFLGETVQLNVFVHGYQPDLGAPDLAGLDAKVQLLGQQDRSQRSRQIINGQQTLSERSKRIFTYRIEPHNIGTLSFSPITLTEPDGSSISIESPPSLEVKPIPFQTDVQIWVAAPTNTIIVDEEFEVSLFVRIRRLPPPFEVYSPLPTPPHLRIPYLDLHPGEGLQSENITQLLQRLLVSQGESFRINDRVLGRDPFGGIFSREETARFRLPRIIDPDNENYFLYQLSTRWTADRVGDYMFGPVRFRGNVITNSASAGTMEETDIYALGEAATVKVRTPPRQGRPPTFIGAAGSEFSIETTLDTQECQAGDPVTLTVEITGDGAANRIRSLRPESLRPLEADFRVHTEPSRTQSISGGRRFEYLIRPRHDGTLEIPALEIAYFDLTSRQYKTVASDPLPIRVNPPEEWEHAIITGLPHHEHGRHRFTAPPGDLPPAPFVLQHETYRPLFRPVPHLILLLVGPVIFLLITLRKQVFAHLPILQSHLNRKNALVVAKQKLDEGNTDSSKILREYLTTAIHPSFAKGNSKEMELILQDCGLAQEAVDGILEILTQKAYAGNNQTASSDIRAIIEKIDAVSGAPRRPLLARLRRTIKQLLLIMIVSAAGIAQADQISRFEERRSNLHLLHAQTEQDFLTAAVALADRLDQGDRSPTLLYNLGTTLLLAEQPDLALPILYRAERRGSESWNTRRNILVAERMVTQNPALQLPWFRALLFWHYRFSASQRIAFAATLFSALCILIGLRSLGYSYKWLTRFVSIVLLFLLMSISESLYAEYQAEQDWQLLRRQIDHIHAMQHEEDSHA